MVDIEEPFAGGKLEGLFDFLYPTYCQKHPDGRTQSKEIHRFKYKTMIYHRYLKKNMFTYETHNQVLTKYLLSIILIQRPIWEVLPVLCLFQNSCNPHGLRTWSVPQAVCCRQELVWAPSEREVGSLSVPLFLRSSLSPPFELPAKKQICFTVSHETGQIISANTCRCNIKTIDLPVLQTSL